MSGVSHLHSWVPCRGQGHDLTQGHSELCAEAEQERNRGGSKERGELKVIVLGEAGVGKTALVRRVSHGDFEFNYKATIGVDFEFLKYEVFEEPVTLACWDTAGQERFSAITRKYYLGAQAAVVVYDDNDSRTFDKIGERWLPELKRAVGDIPLLLVANKCDLASFVDDEAASEYAQQNGMEFYKVSAKDDIVLAPHSLSHKSLPARIPVRGLFDRLACVLLERALLDEAKDRLSAQKKPTTEQATVVLPAGSRRTSSGSASGRKCCK
ncbi:Ras-related protein Rab-1 [Diplonema papillatum]|nr:Ras-related protein Rab-1 [Diplonema papillatum]